MTRRQQQFRIIGGQWRGRRLTFPSLEQIRPTPDRVRETLFNWLAPLIDGARCVDLFAGSGALGLEALSRGAESVVFVEQRPPIANRIRENLASLNLEQAVICADALYWLEAGAESFAPFDIALLDPPFGQQMIGPACRILQQRALLAAAGRVYLESEPDCVAPLPEQWRVARDKSAGEVRFRLAVVETR